MTNAALAVVLAATVALGAIGCALWLRRRDLERLRAMEARVATAGTGERIAVRRLEAVTGELRRLAKDRIPAGALALNHPNAPVPAPPRATEMGPDDVRALDEALEAALTAVSEERERVDAAARAAMRGATAKVQSLLYQIQSLLHDLQHENDDPRLLELDFRNELALRRIQATAVLCEAWPGLARTDSPLTEIVRGAQSRVPGYARVKVANHLRKPRIGVVARAAEPLAIALAELLANATAYSHPETEVPVTLQQGGGGSVFVVIDDAGVGMDEDTLARARRLLASPDGVLLTELGNPPQAGFAVVGRLAGQYGFTCHVEPSPYGGVRAMLRVPVDVLTEIEDDHTLSILAPEPVPSGRVVTPPPNTGASGGSAARGADDPVSAGAAGLAAEGSVAAVASGGLAAEGSVAAGAAPALGEDGVSAGAAPGSGGDVSGGLAGQGSTLGASEQAPATDNPSGQDVADSAARPGEGPAASSTPPGESVVAAGTAASPGRGRGAAVASPSGQGVVDSAVRSGEGPGASSTLPGESVVAAGTAASPGEGQAAAVGRPGEGAAAGPTPSRSGAAVASPPGQGTASPSGQGVVDSAVRSGEGLGASSTLPGESVVAAGTASSPGEGQAAAVGRPGQGAAVAAPAPSRSGAAVASPPGQGTASPPGQGTGLPSRRRRVARVRTPAAAAPAAARSPEEADARWSALQQGTRQGRSAAGDSAVTGAVGDRDDMGGDAS
ncbi:ATP-binding protein [Streptomyces sp. NBRC 109706]|uniref:ATP-binding protein n=1 Tax=Streptomyces sp. NBRC 109706 TaxID=1550035 RepID=UPI0007862D6C|nr:ATP-binding protein [Streptomyces sp. NBRC 109706]